MNLAEKKLALFDAHLSHRGLQHLVDVAAELLGNPLFMADMSMGIVCKSSNMGEGEQDFSAEGDPDRQYGLAKQAADAGFMDWIYHHDQPVIGEFEGQPRYLSARVRDGGQVLGHVVVVEVNRQFSSDDEALLPVFCQTLSYELRRTRSDGSSAGACGPLLGELIAGSTREEDDARKRLQALGFALSKTVRLVLFRPIDERKVISLAYLRAQLEQAFLGSMGIIQGNECLQVINGRLSIGQLSERISKSVYCGGMAVGVSRPFAKVTLLDWAYRQADAAIRLADASREGAVNTYDDVAAQHLLEVATASDARAQEAFVVPEIALIEAFDARDHTDYLRSLAAYLNSGRNVAKASRMLGVHKNSMYYRIQRIEELADVDLADERACFLLQLSLAMRGMGPKA